MGCGQSKPQEPARAQEQAQVPAAGADGQAAGNLLVAPKPAEAAKVEPRGTPFVTKRKHHTDPIIMMYPYFKVSPEQFEQWKEHCDEFYKAAMETDDLLCYGMAFNDGGVHVRQGYRSAAALLEHLRRADRPMTDALKHSTLQRVEVHGPRRQLAKVKRQMTKVGDCLFQFFETCPKMTGIRRPTEFSGTPGSDTLVSCHVSINIAKFEELKVIVPKIRAVHRRARCSPGNESFSVSMRLEQGVVTLVATFDSMEAAVEHLACLMAHLGAEALHTLEMHGPEAEMAKLRALMDGADAAGEAAAGLLQEALVAAAKKAAEDAREAKACAEAAARVAAAGVSEAAREARERMVATLEDLQKKAEEMAQVVYRDAMKAAGAEKAAAKALADQAYKRAMQAAAEVRQAADAAAKKSYEVAVAAGTAAEQALEGAHQAAEAAARSMHEELMDVYEATRSTETAAAQAVEDAGDAVQAEAQESLEAAKMAAELSLQALKGVIGEAAKESRRATLRTWDSIKKASEEAVKAVYAKERAAEAATEETLKMAADRARAAAWAVVSTSEHVYFAACEEALAAGKAADQAKEVAAKAAEAAVDKAVAVWRRGEQLTADAVKAAEAMVNQAEKALERAWERTTTYVLDAEKALRRSLHKAEVAVQEEIDEATEDVAWAVDCVVEEANEDMREARDALLGRIQAWHDALLEAEVSALRAVADAADAKADSAERKKKSCCC